MGHKPAKFGADLFYRNIFFFTFRVSVSYQASGICRRGQYYYYSETAIRYSDAPSEKKKNYRCLCWWYTVGLNSKNPPKNQILKIREIDWSCFFLQRFDKFWISSVCYDRKRKLCESAETCLEKHVKLHRVNLFLAGF